MKKKVSGYRKCARCGGLFTGHGSRKYCGDVCAVAVKRAYDARLVESRGAIAAGYSRLRSSVLRGLPKGSKSSPVWRLGLSEYSSAVGVCGYCGGDGLWMCRVDNAGVWEPGNVICACGVCSRMRTGFSHSDFIGHIQRIVTNLSKE